MSHITQIFSSGLLLVLAVAGSASQQARAQEDNDPAKDVVTIHSGGERVTYPPINVTQRGETTAYIIDMDTASFNNLSAGDDTSVSMTWARAPSGHTICFEHSNDSRCREFDWSLRTDVAPRFLPTLIGRWPTVYVRFVDESDATVWIGYVDGEIITLAEDIERMRSAHLQRR